MSYQIDNKIVWFSDGYCDIEDEEGKSREVYHKASKYITAILKLNKGSELVEKILIDLKNSDYQKRSALFDEINKVIKK